MRRQDTIMVDHRSSARHRGHRSWLPRSVVRLVAWAIPVAGLIAVALFAPISPSAATEPDWDAWRPGSRDGANGFQDSLAIGRESDGLLYGCRGYIKQDMHVGRIRPDFGGCHVAFDGKEVEVKPYELLSLSWRGADAPLAGAVLAGSERVVGGETPFATASLYVCRASYQGGIHPGQVRAGERGCSFGYGGKRIVASSYEVMQAAPWLTWLAATSRSMPETAVVSGSEGNQPFFTCRATDRFGLHPGKVKQGPIGCSIVSEGREMIVDRFEVLATRWLGGHAGTVPIGAAVAGRENGDSQYICRAVSRDTVQVGKVSEALGGCHIGMQSREVVLPDYEVLSQ